MPSRSPSDDRDLKSPAADPRPLKRKYSRIERERRFVLARLPEAVDPEDYQRLRDCFVRGTHLRLREVSAPDGTFMIAKLGQKIVDPDAPNDNRRRLMTTIYLDAAEAGALPLDGLRTSKRRYKLTDQGHMFCIDVWESPASTVGIIVAEVECDSDEALATIRCPAWAEREVTDDPTYSAICLAKRD